MDIPYCVVWKTVFIRVAHGSISSNFIHEYLVHKDGPGISSLRVVYEMGPRVVHRLGAKKWSIH